MPENMAPRSGAPAGTAGSRGKSTYQELHKPAQIRFSNTSATKAVADAVRTSLGPKGMDKMIQDGKGDMTITSDGAAILRQMQVLHPAAKMLVELSKAQDTEAGDGTTSVIITPGSLLDFCTKLLQKGIHPTIISKSFQEALEKGLEILTDMAQPVELSDRETLLNSATTLLNSKAVSQYSNLLSPMSVNVVMKVIDPAMVTSVDLGDIKIVKKLGETIDDCSAELAEEVSLNGSGKLFKITSCASTGKTVTIVVRGSNKLVMEEAECSIHDALCVICCLVKKRTLIAGGGGPEIELALRLTEYSRSLSGMESYCVCAFRDAMEIIPSTLAENVGQNPISTVTELRNRHAQGEKTIGINIRKGGISIILEEMVVQPLLVSVSALILATETVWSILKIDDGVNTP
ncbi:T-complex protein 1 subunit delta [Heterocephalus glaber]|uniref:T-complex protein 1 subunit delta n=1 Tax=Heterocephalus glaber TaxID=10181 RepID=G5B434_HETGA|nr:T-complex protein 1 subunit delta [Heterocephalus glaber]